MVSDINIKIIAPAKVNLTLHVTGQRDDGYHLLYSLVAFSENFGDEITITPAEKFQFTQNFNHENPPDENNNLIVKSAKTLAKHYNKTLPYHIHLDKKIPTGAGLGGGSSDAASIIKALLNLWNITPNIKDLNRFMLSLGADIPVCYYAKLCTMAGIGEEISSLSPSPPLYALLVHPNKFTSTHAVFKNFNKKFSSPDMVTHNIWQIIKNGKNDLTQSAIKTTPVIQDVLNALNDLEECQISRMSGSGSCCFGLFKNEKSSVNAAQILIEKKPDWWVQPVILK